MRVGEMAHYRATRLQSLPSLDGAKLQDELLREQTDAFEALLVKEVLDIALKSENPLFPKEAGDEIYRSMYNDTMSRALSGGFGFSQILFDFLKQRV